MNQPPPATYDKQIDYNKKKAELEEAFKEFHKLVGNKVLEKNKSPAVKKTELEIINRLVRATQALDNVNVGEGILALASIAVREQLYVRDRVNELEYEICLMKKDMANLQKRLAPKNDKETK